METPSTRRVAVIGAGISGVCAAANLLKQRLSVTVLERCNIAGGVWHFDQNSAHDPDYPNNTPSKGDYTRYSIDSSSYITPPGAPDRDRKNSADKITDVKSSSDNLDISHAPPGPCYSSLKNNVPLTLMKTSLLDWPAGLEEFVSQIYLEQYIQDISKVHGVEQVTEYNTRVESVIKSGVIWEVRTANLTNDSWGNSPLTLRTKQFDAVVVGSGHYHMPRVPDIPGLRTWKTQYPTRVRHSKTYRSADGFENQKVLLIGSGVSSCDIAKDMAVKGTMTFQSSRGGVLDLPTTFLPKSALRIGPVKGFKLDNSINPNTPPTQDDALPGSITLQDGSKLCGIHQVIMATGYITSYPFLSQYHSDSIQKEFADEKVLVTSEGDMVHNLHKDIFYIEDPTLAFVGVPYHIATFSLFEFQAQVVARFLGASLRLPNRPAMRAEYEERVRVKGLGRDFHSLRDEGDETTYVKQLAESVNRDAAGTGSIPMNGHSPEWLRAYAQQKERIKFLRGSRRAYADASGYDHISIPAEVHCA